MDDIRCLKRYFELKSLHVSDYWLQCCLEWFRGEFNNYSEDLMCNTVYQQWLDTDLRDIEVRSLPNNLNKQKKFILNGNYAVQVMYVKDISKSSYSQLKNIRDMYTLTRELTDNENEYTQYTESGKRVLNLNMTDGVQFINGFEYQSVSCLNLYLIPGIKILLLGPLLIRNGEFLFKESNIQILGGEVESIQISNATENILARELNMPENPNPKINKTGQVNNNIPINTNVNINNTQVVNNLRNEMPDSEDQLFLNNFDTPKNNQQRLTNQLRNANIDDDLNLDNDLFENFDTECFELESKGATNILNNSTKYEKLEEMERQQVEQEIEDEEDFITNFDEDIALLEKIEEEIKFEQKHVLPIVDNPEPFVYIKQLLENRNKLLNRTYTVKARFQNNVEKIQVSRSKGWTMKFEIKDSTGKMVIDFSSVVIEKLMEMSPDEALAENRRVRNKEIKSNAKLSEALVNCKRKFETNEYIIKLEFNEGKSIATIIDIETVKKNI